MRIKSCKPYAICLAALLALFAAVPANIRAESGAVFSGGNACAVIQVIDSTALKVRAHSGQTALVRLIGITASDDAMEYMANTLMGATVDVVVDSSAGTPRGRYNMAYVYVNGVLLNNILIQKGLAKVDKSYAGTQFYALMQNTQADARNNGAGMWNGGGAEAVNGVNINTATAEQLSGMLQGVSLQLANDICAYRYTNAFDTVREIKFVPGFTKRIFDANRGNMVVSTNLNTSTQSQLQTLGNLSPEQVLAIYNYASVNRFTSADQLVLNGLIDQYAYYRISPYVGVAYASEVSRVIPQNLFYPLNSAGVSQMISAGASLSEANAIYGSRGAYTYKTVGELGKIPGHPVSQGAINSIQDNLYLPTPPTDGYVNINTATVSQMTAAGIPASVADKIWNLPKPITAGGSLSPDITAYNAVISLYTNVNAATLGELMSLNNGMTEDMADAIIQYVKDQPFGGDYEFSRFISAQNSYLLSPQVRDLIVYR